MESVQSTSVEASTIEEITEQGTQAAASGNLAEFFSEFGKSALNYLIRIGIAILILVILWKVLKKLTAFIEKYMASRNIDISVRSFVGSLVKWTIMILAVIEICIWLNIIEASTIAAIVAAVGVGVSLSIQGTVSNFAGGILILSTKPFRVGDYIKVPAVSAEGTVIKIDMYYTTIETMYHERVSIPNSSLTNNQVTNLTSTGERLVCIDCGISYNADIAQAKKIMEHLMSEDSRIDMSKTSVIVKELGESAITLEMRAQVTVDDYWQVKWDMNERIKLAFDQAGIEIPYNQLDVHIRES